MKKAMSLFNAAPEAEAPENGPAPGNGKEAELA
jgi:hypothetical protein